jgi:leucine dehydrogenase
MEPGLAALDKIEGRRIFVFSEPAAGLRAFLVIDSVRGGMAAGGTRTRAYASPINAVHDARQLSRAMALKCAIAGLQAGGAKMVVLDHPGLDRANAFRALGRRVQELGGLFQTAGDLGTTPEDLAHMAQTCRFVRTNERVLAAAAARGVRACAEACVATSGHTSLRDLRVAVQGCGAMGSAVAGAFADAGAILQVADLDPVAAARVAAATGARVVPPEAILAADVDILAPCATGSVIDHASVEAMRAWAVCGAANNILADESVGLALTERGILFVPDFIASAGAVIAGVCGLQGRDDAEVLIEQLGVTTRAVLEEAADRGVPTTTVARQHAEARLPGQSARTLWV